MTPDDRLAMLDAYLDQLSNLDTDMAFFPNSFDLGVAQESLELTISSLTRVRERLSQSVTAVTDEAA